MIFKNKSLKFYSFLLIFCGILLISGCGKVFKEEAPATVLGYNLIKPDTNTILALYDSSEKRDWENNEIRKLVEDDLDSMGLTVKYYDINKGLPAKSLTSNIRGVITWFSDSKIKNADKYCEWLSSQITDGKKVIILGNFGAYQDLDTEVWTDMSVVNKIFNNIGVEYRANWTGDDSLLEVVYQNTEVVGTKSPVDLGLIRHYYLFSKVDPQVNSFLSVQRNDLEESESQIIFSHPNGGMALSRYLTTYNENTGKNELNINIQAIVEDCLFSKKKERKQKILVIWEAKWDKDQEYIKNLIWTFRYSKVDFDIIDYKNLETLMLCDLKKYSSIVLLVGNLWNMANEGTANILKQYVSEGGGFCVAHHAENALLKDMFGITRQNDFYKESLEGMKVSEILFPGSEEFYFASEFVSYSAIDFDLKSDVEILARAVTNNERYPEGIPVAWINKYGKGRVVFWDSSFMHIKFLRSMLLQSVMLSQGMGIYSLANIESIHMDDCPQPMYNALKEPIKTEYGMTDTKFYMDVWWKDITDLAKKYNIHFTFYTIFNYGAKVDPPFDNREFEYGEDSAFSRLVQRVTGNNFELGLHGYNHQSLIKEDKDTPGWKDEENMEKALIQGRKLWEEEMPEAEMPFSYVAPMNVIDTKGIKALHKVFPEIRVVSQHYSAAIENRAQEFQLDPDVPEVLDFPRSTFGYEFDQDNKNNMLDLLNIFGVWTHFLHPDDVFGRYSMGKDASGGSEGVKSWQAMLESTQEMFDFVRKNYPWLRNMTTKDAYYEMIRYFNRRVNVILGEDIIKVNFTSGTSERKYFCLRINDGKQILELSGCRLLHSYEKLDMFVLESDASSATIMLTDK